jgi:hypothetical protein
MISQLTAQQTGTTSFTDGQVPVCIPAPVADTHIEALSS